METMTAIETVTKKCTEGWEKGKAEANGRIGRKGKPKRRLRRKVVTYTFEGWNLGYRGWTGMLTPRIKRTLGTRLERRLGFFGIERRRGPGIERRLGFGIREGWDLG